MRWIRPRLARVAGGWLVFHLCLLAAVPTALGATMSASSVGAECTCDHGDGQICPMHHTRSKAKSTPDSHPCSCRSTADPDAAIAASLIGPTAVLVPPASVVAPTRVASWLPGLNPEPLDSSFVPDSPPPRA